MGKGLTDYRAYLNTPWGKLFYRIALAQLGELRGKRILDFGSGFGITSDALAASNDVTAIEPNGEMADGASRVNMYRQIVGGAEKLASEKDGSYDVILCHNVLEYVEDRAAVMREFSRLISPDGSVSVIKHNHAGKVMQTAILANDLAGARALLDGADAESNCFGRIGVYGDGEVEAWSDGALRIADRMGIRIFFGLQPNEVKTGQDWSDEAFALEMSACRMSPYYDVAFYHHIIMRKDCP